MKSKFAVILLILFITSTADACTRCGIFGLRCRFRSHSTVHHVNRYIPPANLNQTFVFGGVPVSQSFGTSTFGYSASQQYSQSYQSLVQPYRASASDLINQLSRTNDNVQALTNVAAKQLDRETEVNRLLAASQALTATINAAREETAQLNQAQSMIVTIKNGKVEVQPIITADDRDWETSVSRSSCFAATFVNA